MVLNGAISANGAVTLRANDRIVANSASSITTQGQAITLNADRDASGAGAISLTSATLTSNGGDITLGGGADPATTAAVGTASLPQGIALNGSSSIQSGAGAISLRGQGVAGGADPHGVLIGSGASVRSTSGDIRITGQGGTATSGWPMGVRIAGTVASSGSGAVSVTGTGGSGGNYGRGVNVSGGTVQVQDGTLSITGTGGSASTENTGVVIEQNATGVRANGSGAIQITGTGGSLAQSSGVRSSSTAAIVGGAGGVTLTGSGGAAIYLDNGLTLTSGSGALVLNGDSITLGSAVSGSGSLTIQPITPSLGIGLGNGAVGTLQMDDNELLKIQDGFSSITIGSATGTGAVDIRTSSFHDPLTIRSPQGSGRIGVNGALSTGSGSSAGSITLQAGDAITSVNGASITTQGQVITLNADRDASGAGAIQLTGTTINSNNADIVLGGGLNPRTTAAYGTAGREKGIQLVGGSLQAGSGNISMRGAGRGAGATDGSGVVIGSAASVATTTGNIFVSGAAGASTGTNLYGVYVVSGSSVSSAGGAIELIGTGGSADVTNKSTGVGILGGSSVTNTGSGSITMTGTGGSTCLNCDGVDVRTNTLVSVENGSLTVNGDAGVGNPRTGFLLLDSARMVTTGSGAVLINSRGSNTDATIATSAELYGTSNGSITLVGQTSAGLELSGTARIGQGSVGTYSGALTLTTDKLNLVAPTGGTGTLLIQPYTPSAGIGLGNSAAGALNLTASELSVIQDGFSSITIGSATGTGAIDVRTAAFSDPVTIRSPSGSGSITLNGALSTGSGSSAGSISLQAGGALTGASGSSITTQNQAIQLTGAPVSGAMTIQSNGGAVGIHQTGSGTVSGVISGAGGLTKSGSGTLTLTGANSYSGTTAVSAGTLQVGGGGSGLLGSGNIFLDTGSRLIFNTTSYNSGPVLNGNLSGSGTLEVDGTAASRKVGFGGDNSGFTGTFLVDTDARANLHSASAGSASADFEVNGLLATVVTGGTFQFGSLSGNGVVSQGGGTSNTVLEVGGNNQSSLFAGNIGNCCDSASLRKVGSGTWTLTGNNTYIGTTSVNQGTLRITGAGRLGSGTYSGLAVAAGTVFEYASSASQTLSAISGAGTLNHSGPGTLTLSGTPSFTGTYNLNGPTTISGAGNLAKSGLGYASAVNIGGYVTLAGGNNSFLGFQGGASATTAVTLNPGGTLYNPGATFHLTNGITFNGGTLASGPTNSTFSAFGSYTFDKAVYVNADSTASALNMALNSGGGVDVVVSPGATLTVSGSIDRPVNGGGAPLRLQGGGTLELLGDNTYTGATTISAGTLRIGAGGTSGSIAATSALTNNANVVVNRSDDIAVSGVLGTGTFAGSGSLVIQTAGQLTVDRSLDLSAGSGDIRLSAGAGKAAGDPTGGDVVFTGAGAVTTGSQGTISVFTGHADTAAIDARLSGADGSKQKTYGSAAISAPVAGGRNLFYRETPLLTVSGVTVAPKTYDGNASAVLDTTQAATAGLVDGLTVTYPTAGTFNSPNVPEATTVSFSAPTVGSSDGYTFTGQVFSGASQTSANAGIARRDVTISASGAQATYGDSATLGGFAVNGLVAGETVDTATLQTDAPLSGAGFWQAGQWSILVQDARGGSADLNRNYRVSYAPGTLNVAARDLAVTDATAVDKFFDGTPAATVVGATVHGLGGDLIALSDAAGRFASSLPGRDLNVSTTYTLGGADARNYRLLQPPGLRASILAPPAVPDVLPSANNGAAQAATATPAAPQPPSTTDAERRPEPPPEFRVVTGGTASGLGLVFVPPCQGDAGTALSLLSSCGGRTDERRYRVVVFGEGVAP